jgi:hypothetical protein
MKQRCREANEVAKERRRAQKARRSQRQVEKRVAQDQQLMILVRPATRPDP